MNNKEQYLLQTYHDLGPLDSREDIRLKRNVLYGNICVQKYVSQSQKSVYLFLKDNHVPCVPKIHECIREGEQLVIIEEYIQGRTLEETLHEKTLTMWEIANILLNLCDCLEVLHNARPQIICRDIKAENIVTDQDGGVWLVDFNIARSYQSGKNRDTELLGTAEYAAPEQFGFFQTDNRTDIFSMGVLLNYMTVGKFPVEQIASGAFEDIIRKCIQLEPAKRYQSVEELRNELMEIIRQNQAGEKNGFDRFDGTEKNAAAKRGSKLKGKIGAAIACAFFAWLCYDMEMTSESVKLTEWMVRVEQTIVFLSQLALVAIISDFRGMRKKMPLVSHKNKIVRIIGYVAAEAILIVLAGILCGIFEMFFH